jgi:hypothetical protein
VSTWRPIADAPRDGTVIQARGWNFGDPSRGSHIVRAVWSLAQGRGAAYCAEGWRDADDPDQGLQYLVEWRPTAPPNLYSEDLF